MGSRPENVTDKLAKFPVIVRGYSLVLDDIVVLTFETTFKKTGEEKDREVPVNDTGTSHQLRGMLAYRFVSTVC